MEAVKIASVAVDQALKVDPKTGQVELVSLFPEWCSWLFLEMLNFPVEIWSFVSRGLMSGNRDETSQLLLCTLL